MLLGNISEEMNKGDLQSTERFIFVLNIEIPSIFNHNLQNL